MSVTHASLPADVVLDISFQISKIADPAHAGVYFDVYNRQVDLTKITTLHTSFTYNDAAGADPFLQLLLDGVQKWEVTGAGGFTLQSVDCSAISGIHIIKLQYKSGNDAAYVADLTLWGVN